VHIVDMREELKNGNRSIFSNKLRQSMHEVLQNDQQAILFLNRRGSATFVFCRECGFVARCPLCDLPLASHVDQNKLICHTCGYQRGLIEVCPQCGKKNIREYGTGTQKVERLVKEEFPAARVLRWDTDTALQKGAEEILLSHFIQHRADVLIGTQMLAKGLDLPFVTLVGVILADVGLNFPDYRAVERTFQVLMQVAGRAGRSLLGGQVVLQTFQPWHYAIQRAAQHDFAGFYTIELEHRRKLEYPPFKRLVRLEMSNYHLDETTRIAQDTAEKIRAWLRAENKDEIEVIGPAPAFFGRISGKYRWQILLKGADPVSFLRHHPLTNYTVEVDPPNIL